jgi:3-isopropylmalate/(R)-2-methylmalate dehydratase small subunit
MEGLDEIGMTLAQDTAISKFESGMAQSRPWIAVETANEGIALEATGRT